MKNLRSNWRGCKDWIDFGLPLTTTSDEACKYYDASLTQMVGYYDETSVGGMENSMKKMMAADPNFVMGHVITNGLNVIGACRNTDHDSALKTAIANMETLAEQQNVTDIERKHVKAVKLRSEREVVKACQVWEDILIDNPLDMLALQFALTSYINMGFYPELRDGTARIKPFWKPFMPLYGYLEGMHAFGLEETNLYDAAEKAARRGLDYNRYDIFASHALAHVFEMQGRTDEGIQFLSSTENDWNVCGMFAGHNYWHYGLYHIEKGNYSDALGIYDNHILPGVRKRKSFLYMVDACSLLYRLQLEGVKEADRYTELQEICQPHHDDHVLVFADAQYLMTSLGCGDKMATQKLMDSLKKFVTDGKGDNWRITKEIGLPLCEAIVACEDGNYSTAVDLVNPIRYQISQIGGSNAQRDVFNLFHIHCAMNSDKKEHRKLARQLLTERKCLKENSPLTDRLMAQVMAQHID